MSIAKSKSRKIFWLPGELLESRDKDGLRPGLWISRDRQIDQWIGNGHAIGHTHISPGADQYYPPMRRDQALLAATIVLLATSLGSSIAAYHFYTQPTSPAGQPQPHGSFSDDGYWNPFQQAQFWDPFQALIRFFSQANPFQGQF